MSHPVSVQDFPNTPSLAKKLQKVFRHRLHALRDARWRNEANAWREQCDKEERAWQEALRVHHLQLRLSCRGIVTVPEAPKPPKWCVLCGVSYPAKYASPFYCPYCATPPLPPLPLPFDRPIVLQHDEDDGIAVHTVRNAPTYTEGSPALENAYRAIEEAMSLME